jgi:hypothetical protein
VELYLAERVAVSTSKGIPAVTAAILETVQLISQSVYLIRQALESIRHEVIAPIDGILSNIEWATHRLATWQATHVELQPEIERMLHSFSSIRSSAFWIDVLLASLPPLHRNIELQLRKASVAEILHSYFGLLAAEAQERRVRCQIEHESLPMIRADLNHLRRAYKHHTFTLLGMQAGHHLLDVGCGTGEDVRALARLVGSNGRVVGLDIREELIAEARKRAADTEVEFYVGDIYTRLFHLATLQT